MGMKWIGILLFFNSVNLFAQAQTTLPLVQELFNEKYNSNVPVSGRVIAGVMFRSAKDPDNELSIFLAPLKSDLICFKVQSKDGTYYSANEYKVPESGISGSIFPEYPTKYKKLLNEFDDTELALLAFSGNCDSKQIDTILISARSQTGIQEDVVMLVNSGRSDVFLITAQESGKRKTTKCKRIIEGKRTAYDTQCLIEVDSLIEGINELSIIRRKPTGNMPSVKFNVLFSK
jgi:hypothetical protein